MDEREEVGPVDLMDATTEQIFDELTKRYRDVVLVIQTQDLSSTPGSDRRMGFFASDGIACLGLLKVASARLTRDVISEMQCDEEGG